MRILWAKKWQGALLVATQIFNLGPVYAIQESNVGVIDWHKPLLGLPDLNAPFTWPTFHRVRTEANTSSVIIRGSKKNVLGAIDPVNGELAWRHLLPRDDVLLSFQVHPKKDLVAALSGPGGSNVRLLTALRGELIYQRTLHPPELGKLEEPAWLGSEATFDPESSTLYVLTNGYTITKIDAKGDIVWTWTSPTQGSSILYTNIIATATTVYAIGIAPGTASYGLHVTSISSDSGKVIESLPIPSSVKGPFTHFLLSSGSTHALAWVENSQINTLVLEPELLNVKANIVRGAYAGTHNIGRHYQGVFVAQEEDGTAHVLALKPDGSVEHRWEFSGSAHDRSASPSIFTGGLDKEGNVYVSRTYWSFAIGMASMNVYSSGEDGKGQITGFTFALDSSEHGIIQHVAIDVASPNPLVVRPRFLVSTSLGANQLWDKDKLQWTREESLSEIVEGAVQFIELPQARSGADITQENFLHRLFRQVSDAQNFPSYALDFVRRFVTGQYEKPVSALDSKRTDTLHRDTFGFRQVILVATATGKVIALDSSNGAIIYSRVLSLGGTQRAYLRPVKLFITRTVAEANGGDPHAALVAELKTAQGTTTLVYRFNAFTGLPLQGELHDGMLKGNKAFSEGTQHAYLHYYGEQKTIFMVDDKDKLHAYPNNTATKEVLAALAPKIHIPLVTGKSSEKRLVGHSLTQHRSWAELTPTWTASIPPGHHVRSIFKAPQDQPIASIGQVLGDRRTLYKYLNRHLIGVISSPNQPKINTSGARCTIQLVDGVSGKIVYRANVPYSADNDCDIKAALTENWLVYHYWNDEIGSPDESKGWRMVSVQLYEGEKPDDKTRSSETSSFALDEYPIAVYEQSFVFPRAITAMSISQTKYGMTTKDLIVASANHQVQLFPKPALNPRRPKGKPTAAEQEEWLTQYEPLLPDDSRRVISHKYQVAGVRDIVTSPTLLESTSLVFTYGLDLFLTRVSPSGTFDLLSESFNKAQLVLITAGLTVGILVVKPMVRRKKLREQWYQ
ncbi:DUF1620-domain-containing protein [Sistotremastrum suecicum HHB10207 ss-3]|uniref:ER membrane protein complex subunit 1 n=1 Tax=Sistotremastrum suecicum HHB10207 ss-3 TaxID=1314776 RepID=A0A166CQ75_9AGAM|nr:DUF1620-domain-containing protein [Sistotremastrum suecicum HHB10207 ss-3]